MMRKVKAWLVIEYTDWRDDLIQTPIIAFQSRDEAELCAQRRDKRAEGFDDRTWNMIKQIEVVLDD